MINHTKKPHCTNYKQIPQDTTQKICSITCVKLNVIIVTHIDPTGLSLFKDTCDCEFDPKSGN